MEYGLIGETLKHSFSSEIHGDYFGYRYDLTEIRPDFLKSFLRQRNFKGINVTIPYKRDVMEFLDYIDPIAEKIGAVNTVVNDGKRLSGYNTDFSGLKGLIERNTDVRDKRVLILGTGGTAHTAKAVVKYLGAEEVLTVSRTKGKGDITYGEMYEKHLDFEVLINTTPVGMYPNTDASPVEISRFPDLSAVIDVIYNPIKTKLVSEAQSMGIKAEGGLYMLVCQAAKSSELFTGRKISEQRIDAIYENLSKKKKNIVLIGMPSSGKSTVANELSRLLKRECFDTDNLISRHEKTDIKSIFDKKGEQYFRNIEHEAVKFSAAKTECVIATGGGVILNEKNINLLKQNGVIYFLDRPLKSLIPTSDRPLSSDTEALERLYRERYPLYKKYSDKTVKVIAEPKTVAKTIAEDFLR